MKNNSVEHSRKKIFDIKNERSVSPQLIKLAALLVFAITLWLSQQNAVAQESKISAKLSPDGQAVSIFSTQQHAQVPLSNLVIALTQQHPTQQQEKSGTEEVPTPSPTSEHFRFGEIKFDQRLPITITLSHPDLQHTSIVEPIVYRDDFTPEELIQFLSYDFNPGAHTAAVDDIEGEHVQLFAHSGWWQQRERLMAEPIRFWLEGGMYGPTDNRLAPEETQRRLESLRGEIFTFEQEGKLETFKVVATTFVPEEKVAIVERDTYTLLRSLQHLTKSVDTQGTVISPYDTYVAELDSQVYPTWFANSNWLTLLTREDRPSHTQPGPSLPNAVFPQESDSKSNPPHARLVLVTFCGWGESIHNPDWATATRYIFALEHVRHP